ncbi:MAG: ribulose-phosphate 3-epimerase [Bacteroidetes bacterium]|nr:MAG: ribulose-phosphate 3-epimerase [Bacteroidota bacterium]
MPLIAPSLLAANFLNLQSAVSLVNDSAADWLHLDIMDGRFVPNISFGLPVVSALKPACTKPFDVHLMIEEPERFVSAFHQAGADIITVHYEACRHLHRNLEQIKSLGLKAGVAINPHTPVAAIAEVIEHIDLLLIMSVNPGFGGQKFIEHTYQKISTARQLIDARGATTLIEVDGGVTLANAPLLIAAGANVLVAGNTVFSAANAMQTIAALKG